MHIQESGEMYLETILVLSKKKGPVRSLDVAEYMNFSKPSVSRAVKILKEADYISIDSDGYLTLTPEGKKIAKKIYERHTFLSNFFTSIGVDPDTAASDACKIEHHISDKTFKALKKYIANTHEEKE